MPHEKSRRTLRRVAIVAPVLAFLACNGGGDTRESVSEQSAAAAGTTPPGGSGSVPPAPTLKWPANAVVGAGIVGSMPGGGQVGPDGQYHYQLPLEVPVGR